MPKVSGPDAPQSTVMPKPTVRVEAYSASRECGKQIAEAQCEGFCFHLLAELCCCHMEGFAAMVGTAKA